MLTYDHQNQACLSKIIALNSSGLLKNEETGQRKHIITKLNGGWDILEY